MDDMFEYGECVEDIIDYSKLEYGYVFDKFYYKNKYPLFDLDICEMLSKQCQIKEDKKKRKKNKRQKKKLSEEEIKKILTIEW